MACSESEQHHNNKQSGSTHGGSRGAPQKRMADPSVSVDDNAASLDSGRLPELPLKHAKAAGTKGSAGAARDQKQKDARKQQTLKQKADKGRADEQARNEKSGAVKHSAPHNVSSGRPDAAHPISKAFAPQTSALGGKLSSKEQAGQGKAGGSSKVDHSRAVGLKGTAATQKRSPLGLQQASKSAVWAGDPLATAKVHNALPSSNGGKPAGAKPGVPAAGKLSLLAANRLAKKLPAKEHWLLGTGNGSGSNNSSGADANTAGGPLMLQPSDCFED